MLQLPVSEGASWDEQTNIFSVLVCSLLARINSGVEADHIDRLLAEVRRLLKTKTSVTPLLVKGVPFYFP